MPYGVAAGALISAGSAAYGNAQNQKAASKANQPYLQAINEAEGVANQPFDPYGGQIVAPVSAQEEQAASLAGVGAAESQQYLNTAATPFSGSAIQQYMNPYAQDVTNVATRNLTTNYNNEMSNFTRTQQMRDAFGYGRTAAMSTPLTQQYQQEFGDLQTQGLSAAYNSAVNEFNKQGAFYADLSKQAGNPADNGVSGLLAAGKDVREAQTQSDQAQYGEFLRGQNWSRENIQPLTSMLSATKGSINNPSYTNPLSAAIGGALAGYGAANSGNSGSSPSTDSTAPGAFTASDIGGFTEGQGEDSSAASMDTGAFDEGQTSMGGEVPASMQ